MQSPRQQGGTPTESNRSCDAALENNGYKRRAGGSGGCFRSDSSGTAGPAATLSARGVCVEQAACTRRMHRAFTSTRRDGTTATAARASPMSNARTTATQDKLAAESVRVESAASPDPPEIGERLRRGLPAPLTTTCRSSCHANSSLAPAARLVVTTARALVNLGLAPFSENATSVSKSILVSLRLLTWVLLGPNSVPTVLEMLPLAFPPFTGALEQRPARSRTVRRGSRLPRADRRAPRGACRTARGSAPARGWTLRWQCACGPRAALARPRRSWTSRSSNDSPSGRPGSSQRPGSPRPRSTRRESGDAPPGRSE